MTEEHSPLSRFVSSIDSVLLWRSEGARKELSGACDCINAVHKVPFLPLLPVGYSAPDSIKDEGAYEFIPAPADNGKPLPFRIRVQKPYGFEMDAAQSQFWFLHEIGHFLDQQGWQGNGFASEIAPELEVWCEAVAQSMAVHELRLLQEKPEIFIPQRGNMIFTVPQRTLTYLLRGRELWARSYSQWVAVESGNDKLMMQLEQERQNGEIISLPWQWADKDFLPVAEAITALFSERGWK